MTALIMYSFWIFALSMVIVSKSAVFLGTSCSFPVCPSVVLMYFIVEKSFVITMYASPGSMESVDTSLNTIVAPAGISGAIEFPEHCAAKSHSLSAGITR